MNHKVTVMRTEREIEKKDDDDEKKTFSVPNLSITLHNITINERKKTHDILRSEIKE
jgi:hypothetical protein